MKVFLKSKTFWTGIATVAYGVYLIVQGQNETGFQCVLGGIGLIFLRNGVAKLEKTEK